MKGRVSRFLPFLMMGLLVSSVFVLPASAQEDQSKKDLIATIRQLKQRIEELERSKIDPKTLEQLKNQLDVLTEEVQRLREAQAPPEKAERFYGLGPSASRVYALEQGVSLAGYGEVVYRNENDGTKQADAQRLIMYLGYRFSPHILFNSEIEFEHGNTEENLNGKAGEVSVEFAYLDFLIDPRFNIRAGLLLQPVGIINEMHEPPTFHGVFRPDIARFIIPTTWREIGVGIFGDLGQGIQYKAYLTNGLDARGFEDEGIREGRGGGNRPFFETPAVVGRIDWSPHPSFTLGITGYTGRADQNQIFVDGRPVDVRVSLFEVHGLFQYHGFEARALFASTWLTNVEALNRFLGREGDEGVGKRMEGFYVELAYNIMALSNRPGRFYLAPFIRYEQYDLHAGVAEGFEANPALDRSVWTLGVTFRPHPQVVVKADVQLRDDDAGVSRDRFNLGIGFNF